MRLTWSPRALERAEEILDYIAAESPHAALAWIEGLEQRIDLLVDLSEQGRVVPEWWEQSVREIIYGRYRVIYEISEGDVELLTIKHVRQNLPDGWDEE